MAASWRAAAASRCAAAARRCPSAVQRGISSGSARAQPIRSPPQTDLLNDPIVIVRRSPKTAAGGGIGTASMLTSTNVSSITTYAPARLKALITSSRAAVFITRPVGLWKSGIR